MHVRLSNGRLKPIPARTAALAFDLSGPDRELLLEESNWLATAQAAWPAVRPEGAVDPKAEQQEEAAQRQRAFVNGLAKTLRAARERDEQRDAERVVGGGVTRRIVRGRR